MRAGVVVGMAVIACAGGLGGCHRATLPPRPDGAAVVVAPVEPASEVGVAFVAEVEPNDTPADAQRLVVSAQAPVGVRASLGAVGAAASHRRDVDLYRLDAALPDAGLAVAPGRADGGDGSAGRQAPRGLLRVDVRPEAPLRLELAVLDAPGGAPLAAVASEDGAPVSIPNLAVFSAAVVVRVKAVGSGLAVGGYRLIARRLPFETGMEIEPNDRSGNATPLDPNGEAIGYLGWRNDQDWYGLPTAGLADGSALSVDLDPIPEVVAALQIFDSQSRKLVEARGRKGERVALRNVRVPPSEPQLYLVARALGAGNADARYDLRSHVALLKPGTESEPNDDPAHAQTISDGVVQGYLGQGDVDVFRYATAGPAELAVEVVPPERGSVKLEIQREDGVLLARAESSRHGPARIADQAIPGGPILIRLSSGRGAANPDDPYRLTVSSRPLGAPPSAAPGAPPIAPAPSGSE